MSEKWLDIQSFLSDQDTLTWVNDLSIAIKQELAGALREERADRARIAKARIRQFLLRLDDVLSARCQGAVFGVDVRFKELADEFEAAQYDRANFDSTLVTAGAKAVAEMLDRDLGSSQHLLHSLSELRRIVTRHQEEDANAILEDF